VWNRPYSVILEPEEVGGRAQAVLQGAPQAFRLPVEQLRAAVAAGDGDAAQEPSAVAAASDPASAALASRGTPPADRYGPRPARSPPVHFLHLRRPQRFYFLYLSACVATS
jgi:hypothetical protein